MIQSQEVKSPESGNSPSRLIVLTHYHIPRSSIHLRSTRPFQEPARDLTTSIVTEIHHDQTKATAMFKKAARGERKPHRVPFKRTDMLDLLPPLETGKLKCSWCPTDRTVDRRIFAEV